MSRHDAIDEILKQSKCPPYQVSAVWNGVYKQKPMTTVPASVRDAVEKVNVSHLRVVHEISSSQITKVLFETESGDRIETVRMHYQKDEGDGRYSLCVSSQSGCGFGCTFCATGAIGFKKNLTTEEIVDQVLYFKQKNLPVDNIVFMGMGEPFANPNVFEALKLLTDQKFFGIGPRHISVSTVGIIPGIQRFTKDFPQVNLAYSLHSPFPDERLSLMPVTAAYPIDRVFVALRDHIQKTKRKVFIAYILLSGANDTPRHAHALADLIESQKEWAYLFHVNMIRFHPGPVKGTFEKPSQARVSAFQDILTARGIFHTLRASLGLDEEAACGQLYGEYGKKVIPDGAY